MARKTRRKAAGTAAARPAAVAAVTPTSRGTGWRFWFGLVIFQVIFGASVFMLTRAHYERPSVAARALVVERRAADNVIMPPRVTVPPESSRPGTGITAFPSAPAVTDPTSENIDDLPSETLRQRGSARFTAGEYGEAARLYAVVLGREPGNVELRNNFAISLHYAGRSAEAIRTVREGLETNPGHQRSLLTLGFVSRATGDVTMARDALTRAVNLDAANSIGQEAARFLATLPRP